MPALTSDRNTNRRDGNVFEYPVKAATKIFGGSIVCIDTANNLAIPGKTGLGLKYAGVAQEMADNTAGLDGAIRVRVFRGPESLFRFTNLAADLVVLGNIGSLCYMVDDQTVAKTDGTATRSAAGIVRDVDAGGVWVEM
jgi:hypothetical protein